MQCCKMRRLIFFLYEYQNRVKKWQYFKSIKFKTYSYFKTYSRTVNKLKFKYETVLCTIYNFSRNKIKCLLLATLALLY